MLGLVVGHVTEVEEAHSLIQSRLKVPEMEKVKTTCYMVYVTSTIEAVSAKTTQVPFQ